MLDKNTETNQDDIELTNETIIDEPDLSDIETTEANKIKVLRDKLKQSEAEKMQYLEDLQRAKAEFLNVRRRLEEQKKIEVQRATDSFLISLLPMCDSFAMAMEDEAIWESVDENWRKGVEGIYSQLQTLLKQHNVTTIDPLGQEFNPDEHEALGTEDSDQETDTVVKVIQSGFKRDGDIIRPAKVIIST